MRGRLRAPDAHCLHAPAEKHWSCSQRSHLQSEEALRGDGTGAVIDVVVVGAGPNGLAAALTCAWAGRSVSVLEASATVGGGARTAELTLPGFRHDVCSAIHPLASVSPFFARAGLADKGLVLVQSDIALAHPLDGGRAGIVFRSLDSTVAELGVDGGAWARTVGWTAQHWEAVAETTFGPLLRVPRHPVTMAGFGVRGGPSVKRAARRFHSDEAAALFAGAAAHGFLPLSHPLTAGVALMFLASAHVAGWPVARGGSQAIPDAMAALLTELGASIEVNRPVRSLRDIPSSRAVFFDTTPQQMSDICGDALPDRYRQRASRFRAGPGVFKLDLALSEPVPWVNERARRAGSLHLGGTSKEVEESEAEIAAGRVPSRPFVLVGQQSILDPTRAPADKHTLWAYCHVPNGSTVDMTGAIEAQIERFAPGFRDIVLARSSLDPESFETYNSNYIGGDIAGGSYRGLQLLMRPRPGMRPYQTPNPRFFLCSASTAPGGGVHGMCGANAAEAALRTTLR